MNFTGTHTAPGSSKRINRHVVTLASGIALAASVAIASGAIDRSNGGKVVAEPPVTGISLDSPLADSNASRVVLYIVGTEAEGLALGQQTYEAGHEAPGVDRRVLVADSAEDETAVLAAIGESMQLAGFEVVDLRK